MDEKQDALLNARLFPLSHVGVHGPFLVIARPGFPGIVLDSRLLDSISVTSRSSKLPFGVATGAATGAVLAATSLIPGGLFATVGLAILGHERFHEGRRRLRLAELLMKLGRLEVALTIADGSHAANKMADQLSPYTRTQPISNPKTYEDAKRRFREAASGSNLAEKRRAKQALAVGQNMVRVDGEYLVVGPSLFPITKVRDLAKRGGNLVLADGSSLQAALGLLIVAADKRASSGEDLDVLKERIEAYESWSGHGVVR